METKFIAQDRTKTDNIDARVLAELARVDYLPTVWQPDRDTLGLRHFVTDRESLVNYIEFDHTQIAVTVHAFFSFLKDG